MAATISLCQRNGPFPGVITENINSLSWKAVDDTTTPFDDFNAVLGLGTNSYQLYNYIKFKGAFTTVANVKITHSAGTINPGVKLLASNSIVQTTDRLQYNTPSKSINTSITPQDISAVNSSINLLVGNASDTVDGAGADGKSNSANNMGVAVYTNYFVTQMQVSATATTGDLSNFKLKITYDEV